MGLNGHSWVYIGVVKRGNYKQQLQCISVWQKCNNAPLPFKAAVEMDVLTALKLQSD